MPTKVIVPLLGEGVEEVALVNWLKAEGDPVEEYEGLVEVETDKVVTEIPSPVPGTLLKIVVTGEGKAIPVGAVLAWIGEPGESIPSEGDDQEIQGDEVLQEKTTPSSETLDIENGTVSQILPETPIRDLPTLLTGRSPTLGFISPVVAKIASENNLDLAQIKGTGLKGRITKTDVIKAMESSPTREASLEPGKPQAIENLQALPGTILPHTIMRKRIAEHMVMSKRTSPHVTTLMEADLSRIAAHRLVSKAAFEQNGVRLTYTTYFVAATVEALKTHPIVNSSWAENGIVLHNSINVGMATDLGEEGLIVPVIKNAADRSLIGIARAVNDLAQRARSKKLSPSDVRDATFTITNHGVSGSLLATPIINQPQCGILGIGAIQKRVVVLTDEDGNDSIAIRPMVYLTLTFDHRILDGASADHFLSKVVKSLEQW